MLLAAVLAVCPAGAEEAAHELPEGFCYVHEVIPDALLDIRYAGTHNFVGDVIDGYEGPWAILTVQAAEKLKAAADTFREMGYRILIFDAYRPRRAVRHFVRWAKDAEDTRMKEEFYPGIARKQQLLDMEYIARNSSHCRGSAVDMTLADADGNALDMGTGFDFFGEKAWHGARDVTEEQAANRLLLKTVMEANGFRCFEREWWHYKLVGEPYPGQAFDFPVK